MKNFMLGTLSNMTDDVIYGILEQQRVPQNRTNYFTCLVITEWFVSNLNKVEQWHLVKGEQDVYWFFLDKKNSSSIET